MSRPKSRQRIVVGCHRCPLRTFDAHRREWDCAHPDAKAPECGLLETVPEGCPLRKAPLLLKAAG